MSLLEWGRVGREGRLGDERKLLMMDGCLKVFYFILVCGMDWVDWMGKMRWVFGLCLLFRMEMMFKMYLIFKIYLMSKMLSMSKIISIFKIYSMFRIYSTIKPSPFPQQDPATQAPSFSNHNSENQNSRLISQIYTEPGGRGEGVSLKGKNDG